MAGQQLKYEVQGGDSLQSLARQFYAGNERAWQRIYDLNSASIPDPNYLPPGVTLQIPTDEPVYTVQEGDTLERIAETYHLGGHGADRIWAANQWRYPGWQEREQLHPGMELHIPVAQVEYLWQDRDTPVHVAEIFYGDGGAAGRIVAANPDRLFPPSDQRPHNPLGFIPYPVIIP
jgi:LysM repeat protein